MFINKQSNMQQVMMKSGGLTTSSPHLSGNIGTLGRGAGSNSQQNLNGKTLSERLDKPASFMMPNLSVIDGDTNSSSSSSQEIPHFSELLDYLCT